MISIIIPVYNCEKYLRKMFDGIWKQKHTDFEVICIDDGSKDNSLKVLMAEKLRHSELRVYTQNNLGSSAARNKGLLEARGDYICFVDADDTISESYLSDMYEEIVRTQSDLVISQIERKYEYNPTLLEKKFNYINSTISDCNNKKELMINVINAPYAKLISRNFLEEHSINFIEGRMCQDFLFTQSILFYQARVSIVNKVNYYYLVRKGSISKSKANKVRDIEYVFEILLKIYEESGQLELYREELEYLALHHIAIGMTYRMFISNRRLFKDLVISKNFLRKYSFKSNNKYVSRLGYIERIYLRIFFS